MQGWEIFILVFSGLGIFNSLAFILYIRFLEKSIRIKSVILQVLLFAFILQITHALTELFELNTFPYFSNLYLLGSYCQGPAIYIYLKKSSKPALKIWPVMLMVHVLPYLLISLMKYDFYQPGIREWFAIYLVGIQYLFYIVISIKPYLKVWDEHKTGSKEHFLIVYLFPGFVVLWFYYPFSELTGTNYQIWETFLHSLFVYYLMFLFLKAPKTPVHKYRFSDIDEEESRRIFSEITERIRENEHFLDADLTSVILSRKLNLPLNTLSQVINQNTRSNFRDFINSFRIQKAKESILEKTRKGFTISSIAYDCGFNSLSAFNRAFKKATDTTPSEYIKSKISKSE